MVQLRRIKGGMLGFRGPGQCRMFGDGQTLWSCRKISGPLVGGSVKWRHSGNGWLIDKNLILCRSSQSNSAGSSANPLATIFLSLQFLLLNWVFFSRSNPRHLGHQGRMIQ